MVFLFLLALVGARVRLGIRNRLSPHWEHIGQAKPHEPLEFSIYLRQDNLHTLEDKFHQISNPKNPQYRQFLTQEELDRITHIPGATKYVKQWLQEHGEHFEITSGTSDRISVRSTVKHGQKLFNTAFHTFSHKRSQQRKIVFMGELSVPDRLGKFVDFVGGLSELWRAPKKLAYRLQGPRADEITVTPAVIRDFYGIPANESNAASGNLQAVAAFRDYYSSGAFSEFYAQLEKTPAPAVTNIGTNCLVEHLTPYQGEDEDEDEDFPCDQAESDLDVQYITAIGKGVPTLFHGENDERSWMLAFTEQAMQLDPMPHVISISYGFAEIYQCLISEDLCEILGYDAQKYVNRTSVNFQKLALKGMSVLVADGDDGASNNVPNGENPIDLQNWCPHGCEIDNEPVTGSQCGQIVFRNATSGEKCNWPAGAAIGCEWFTSNDNLTQAVLGALYTAVAAEDCALNIAVEDPYGGVHLYSKCGCEKLVATYKDITVGPFEFDPTAQLLLPDWPTGSAYITSVGATQLLQPSSGSQISEVAASIKTGAIITTGGGFSFQEPVPYWQQQAVNAWQMSAPTKPPRNQYNVTMRGYPDVTMVGHNYLVYESQSGNTCPCEPGGVDGTSASTPAFAGMVSLLNGYLLENNQPPLGFLNPLLYQMYESDPQIFNDITSGDNYCTHVWCFQYGYSTTLGWDPVAGLGSPKYESMKAYIGKHLLRNDLSEM